MTKDFVVPLGLDHFDVTTITTNFQLVAETGLIAPCSALSLINDSNVTIIISFNGVDAHDCVIKLTALDILPQINSRLGNNVSLFAKGTKIWVKGYDLGKFPMGMFYISGF